MVRVAVAARRLTIASLALLGMAGPLPGAAADHTDHWTARMQVARPLGVSVAYDGQGRLWLARVEDRHVWVSRSEDDGARFGPAVRVTPQPEAIAAEGENRPKLAVSEDGTVHVSWTVSLPKPYTGHVRYSRSTDGGRSFSPPVTMNDDGAEISHRFDTLLVQGKRVVLAWLDARDRQAAQAAGQAFTGASLYYAESTDGGATFGPNRRAVASTCECCRVALAWDGPRPVALWRHVYTGNIRDFALAPLGDDTGARRVSDDQWELAGCPHHGGALSPDGQGGLHMVWYTQGKTRQGLFYRRLDGEAMTAPVKFGNDDAQAGHPAVLARGERITLAWREFDGKAYSVWLRHSPDRGESWDAPRLVAQTLGPADYPLLVAGPDGHLARLAWNAETEGLRLFPLEAVEDKAPALPKPFTADSPTQLKASHAGRPYILAFWSLECSHCQAELKTLAALRRQHPGLPLVLVSTDAWDAAPAVARRLQELGLEDGDNHLFADAMAERVRFAVDRKWRGELPRTYLFDKDHAATAVTGAVSEVTLAAWVAANVQ